MARLMREEGRCGKAKGRAKPRTTDSSHARPVAENLPDRQFDVTGLTPAWVSDITYRNGPRKLDSVVSEIPM